MSDQTLDDEVSDGLSNLKKGILNNEMRILFNRLQYAKSTHLMELKPHHKKYLLEYIHVYLSINDDPSFVKDLVSREFLKNLF